MPFNGSGVYERVAGTRIATGGDLVSAQVNDQIDDMITATNAKVSLSGQLNMTGHLTLFTGSNPGPYQAVTHEIARNRNTAHATSVSGTVNAINIFCPTPHPAFIENMIVEYTNPGPNTITNPFLNLDGLGNLTITNDRGGALLVGETGPAGRVISIKKVGTSWYLLNPFPVNVATTAGSNLFNGSQTTVVDDAGTNNVVIGQAIRHTTSGVATTSFGVRYDFQLENNANVVVAAAGYIDTGWVSSATGNESAFMAFGTTRAGVPSYRVLIGEGIYSAGATGGDTGANTANFSAYFVNGVNRSATFISSQQSWSLGSLVTVAHGLGVDPFHVIVKLECVTAEGGYSIGQQVHIGAIMSMANDAGLAVVTDSTNVYVRVGSSGMWYPRFDTGANFAITPGNWRIRVYARA